MAVWISIYFTQVFILAWVESGLNGLIDGLTDGFLGVARYRLIINRLSIFRVTEPSTPKMLNALNTRLLRATPPTLLFTSYTQNHKHGYVTRTRHTSQRPNLPQFIATQPAIRDACFQNLLSHPKNHRLRLPLNHIHTGHHKLCLPLCILTQKNQFASKKRPSYLSA